MAQTTTTTNQATDATMTAVTEPALLLSALPVDTSSAPQTSGDVLVTATDAADSVSAATIDNIPVQPDSPIQITGITRDTGSSASDFITSDNTLAIYGTLSQPLVNPPAGVVGGTYQSVRVSLDGGQTWHDATVNGTTWTYDNTAHPLPDGAYTVEASILSVPTPPSMLPLESVTIPVTQTVVVDTTPPTETVTINGGFGGTHTITGSLSAPLADGSQPGVSAEQLQISLDGGSTWQSVAVAPGSTTWSYTSSTPLSGVGAVEAQITDAAGNHGQMSIVIGTPVLPPLAISDIAHTPDGTLTVMGTATPGDTVTATFLDGITATDTADSSGHYAITSVDTNAMQTSGSVSVVETSPDGVSSQPIAKTWIETTPPPLDAAVSPGGIIFGMTEPGSTVTATLPDGSTMTGIAGFNGVFSLTSSTPLTPGESVILTAANAVGASQPETLTVGHATGALPPPNANGTYPMTSGNDAPPDSTVILVTSDGTTYGTTADSSGHYEFDSWTPVSGPYVIAFSGSEPPVAPFSIDTQVSNPDGTLTVTGVANADDTVTATFADHSSVTGVADSSGHFSITSPSVETSTDVSATDTHADGTTVQTWAGTDTPPPPPAVDVTSMNSNADGTITITGTAVADSLVMVNFPDYSVGTVIVSADGSYSITSGAPQPAGMVVVTDTDAAGNASQPTSYYSDGLPLPPVENVVQNSDGTLTVTGYAPPGDTVAVTFSDGSSTTGMPDASGQYSITSPGAETGEFTLTETSPSGAIIGPLQVMWSEISPDGGVTPAETPTITAISPDTGTSNTDFVTGVGSLTLSGTLSSPPANGASVQVSLDGGQHWSAAATSSTTGAWNFDNTASTLTDGLHIAQARVVDATGNPESAQAVQQITVSANGTLNLSLQDVLSDTNALANAGVTQPITISNGGVVSTVTLAEGVGAGANQWQETSTTTVNGLSYDVYHNTSEGTVTAADLLIQHGITVI